MEVPNDVPIHKSGSLDRTNELLYIQSILFTVSSICVLTRAYIKCFMIRVNLLDDYLIYLAMLGYVAYTAIVIDAINSGGAIGKHPSLRVSADAAASSLRAWYITMVLYPWVTLAVRASVGVLLLRLNTKRSLTWAIRVILAANVIFTTVFFFILLFQCSPPQYFWRQVYGDSGQCYNRLITTNSATVYSVLSALSDWSLGLLPIAILWSVQINVRTKIAIAGLLSLGMVCGIALILRITFITRLEPGLAFLYQATDVAIWSVMEPALGIIAACIATFRPLLKGLGFGWTSRKGRSSIYQLPEQTPKDRFTPSSNDTQMSGSKPTVDHVDQKRRTENSSEHELNELC